MTFAPVKTNEVDFAGRSFLLSDCDGKDLAAEGLRAGTFEAPLPIMLMAMLDRIDGDFLDVGANTGVYTVLAAVTRPNVHIHAFEPYPPVIDVFLENVRVNGMESRVTLHRTALGDKSGAATLYIPDASHGFVESSASLLPDFKDGLKTQVQVEQQRLDNLTIPKLAVIKADIEGHEPAFLDGAIDTIQRDRPVIFAEVLSEADTERLQVTLNKIEYLDFRLRPDIAVQTDTPRFDPLAWNHVFVPPEKMPIFRSACQTHGVEIVSPF